ncbi:alpha/beta hydrolase [Streptomyces sp. TS71-3]|uniref:alpha/beta hydrolase n=1 Tax=Streptomyces sp. TS71-3 TaxID=2733862 RepID=UPI001B07F36F|nr:alpha/beta fold hydrolase [Streptomyces sp. TS71-3]GHJ36855.1 hypothetical protein Sm713_24640 [Streptomyces sp. TS71-3]
MRGAGAGGGEEGERVERGRRGEEATGEPASLLVRVLSVLALPISVVYGVVLAYWVFHSPRRPLLRQPRDVGLPGVELRVPVGGHKFVHAWLCPGRLDHLVVVGHEIGMNKDTSLDHAKFLHEAGYSVCLFDHRNHGSSSFDGSCRRLSDRFTHDVTAVVRYLRTERGYASARLAVYGFSFSGFAVLYSLTQDDDRFVDAVICDSGPGADISPLFRRFLDKGQVSIPPVLREQPSRGVITSVVTFLGTAMVDAAWPPPGGDRYADVPILFLTGEQDCLVPSPSVDTLAAGYVRSEAYVLPNCGHLAGLRVEPEYRRIVLEFLKRALG